MTTTTSSRRDLALKGLPDEQKLALMKIASDQKIDREDPLWAMVQLASLNARFFSETKTQVKELHLLGEQKRIELERVAASSAASLDKTLAAAQAAAQARLADTGKALQVEAVRAVRGDLKKSLSGTMQEVRRLASEKIPLKVWAITFITPILVGAGVGGAVGWLATQPTAEETRLIGNGRLIERAWPHLSPTAREIVQRGGR